MRDALIIPFNQEEELVITTDNSGAIGEKEDDAVKVPYGVVSYFSFRVAAMELLASRSKPTSIILQNFCGDSAWKELVSGIQKGIHELNLENVSITGSTESNFELNQSAIGITIIGKRKVSHLEEQSLKYQRVALIGLPLVGNEVMQQTESVVPLALVKKISALKDVRIWPVGSKGILHELQRMLPNINKVNIDTEIDLQKSGGPSTSMLVQYPLDMDETIKQYAGSLFHKIWEGDA